MRGSSDPEQYRVDDTDQIVFCDYSGLEESIVVPEEVTAIADETFMNNKRIKNIDLRNVRYIGARAFQDCTNLESVIMRNVKVIGPQAFEFCRKLQKVTLAGNDAEGIAELGERAFYHCAALDIPEIPCTLTHIGARAFSHTAIRYADVHWLDAIPEALFSCCAAMEYADISGASEIGDDAFSECRELTNIIFGDVDRIGTKAFHSCELLKLEGLPETLQYIGDDAFCSIRDGFVLPKSVKHIGRNCLGPENRRKSVSIYKSSLYEFRGYFPDDEEYEYEEEHFYLWESSIDVTILDDETDQVIGFLPLFSDLNPKLRSALAGAFRKDNTFDYSVLDTIFYDEMEWNQRGKDRLVLMRLKYPFELPMTVGEEYNEYLRKHAKRIAQRAVRDKDMELLAFLYGKELINMDNITAILDYSNKIAASECTAYLLECQSELNGHHDPLFEEL